MDEIDKELVLALAENNMKVATTSRKVYMHRNTVTYRLMKIEQKTGLNPNNFYDLVKLVGMVQ